MDESKEKSPVLQQNIDMNTNSVCSEDENNKINQTNETPVKFQLNEYYEYDDMVLSYFKSSKYINKSSFEVSNNKVYNLGQSKFLHVLYDIPEEEDDIEIDENFVEILKI